MCYDLSFTTKVELITDYFPDLVMEDQLELDFDTSVHIIAQDYKKYPVIIFQDAHYKLKMFEWGVIADYMNTPEKIKKQRSFMCNARSEKIVDDQNSFWNRIKNKRCLIPVSGIYEHRQIKGWKNKVPYYVRLKDRPLFCLPGLYYYPPLPNLETGEIIGTFTLITRAANPVLKMIHNSGENAFRMPLFLPQELEMKWLLPDLTDNEIREILNYEISSGELEYWPVYSIRSPKLRPDNKMKNEQFEWPNLPQLGL